MNNSYFCELKDKLERAHIRARNKFPKNTMLKLTDKELEDLYYLWTMKAKDFYSATTISELTDNTSDEVGRR